MTRARWHCQTHQWPLQIGQVLSDYREQLEERTYHHLGYPYNLDFDYGPLESLQKYSINNLGDPFIESNYGERLTAPLTAPCQ